MGIVVQTSYIPLLWRVQMPSLNTNTQCWHGCLSSLFHHEGPMQRMHCTSPHSPYLLISNPWPSNGLRAFLADFLLSDVAKQLVILCLYIFSYVLLELLSLLSGSQALPSANSLFLHNRAFLSVVGLFGGPVLPSLSQRCLFNFVDAGVVGGP